MRHPHTRLYAGNPFAGVFALCLFAVITSAQEVNVLDSALSINGTGRVDATGNIRVTNSSVSPTPPGSAPLYHHVTQAGAALEFRMQGNVPGGAVILAMGPPAATGMPFGGETFELVVSGTTLVIDGTTPTDPLNASAYIGGDGSWSIILNQGLPAGYPPLSFQGAVGDPTAPFGVRLTGSITLEVKNDIDTLTRNTVDAFLEASLNPLYLLSLTSSGFLFQGASAPQFLAQAAGFLGDDGPPLDMIVNGVGPNTTTAPPIPAGAPAGGADVAFHFDALSLRSPECAAVTAAGERSREFDMRAVEELGVWKFAGDQREVGIEADLRLECGIGGTIDTTMRILVEEPLGVNGGIANVTVTGPQLASVNASQQATSAANGTQTMNCLDGCGGGDGSEWELTVILGAAGTSRQPIVEQPGGAGDPYTITVTWNDGSPASTYVTPLRAAVDPFSNPTGVADATPGAGTPTAVLAGAGTPAASLAITFDSGTFADPNLASHVTVEIYQGNDSWQLSEILLPPDGNNHTLNVCAPNLMSGSACIELRRQDVFDAKYACSFMVVL